MHAYAPVHTHTCSGQQVNAAFTFKLVQDFDGATWSSVKKRKEKVGGPLSTTVRDISLNLRKTQALTST